MTMGIVKRVFRSIYMKPCWGAKQGYGSMLMFEFGEPHLRIQEPHEASSSASARLRSLFSRRLVTIRGDWRLTIFGCSWKLNSDGRGTVDSDSTRARIRKALAILNGQALVKVSGDPARGRWLFEFDLGAKLKTTRFDRVTELWWLSEPSGCTLSVRGDGRYSHRPPGKIIRNAKWRALRDGEKNREKRIVPVRKRKTGRPEGKIGRDSGRAGRAGRGRKDEGPEGGRK
jgi:hypothetical protein